MQKNPLNSWKTSRAHSFLPPGQPLFLNWAWCPWYGIFPLAILAICLAVLPPSCCTPAHQLNVGDWEKSLISQQ